MLSTSDNPWNPFTHFKEWYSWDMAHGYNTSGLLDRVAKTSMDLSDADFERAIEDAIDEIVKYNVSGVHIKVVNPNANSNSLPVDAGS
jgi:hypothetical protein